MGCALTGDQVGLCFTAMRVLVMLGQHLSHEPWIQMEDGAALVDWNQENEIAYNQANRQWAKFAFYRSAFDFIKTNNIPGDYHEYGCHRARTFRMALTEARKQNLDTMTFYAFDSFAGMPDNDESPWLAGSLYTDEDEFMRYISAHAIYADRVRTIRGYYQERLTADLRKTIGSTIALATVDCDLYESSVCVFNFIEHLLQPGSLLYLDDLFGGYAGNPQRGMMKAFIEYRTQSKWHFIEHMRVGWWGRSYIACDRVTSEQSLIA